jgi:hypothetical protein
MREGRQVAILLLTGMMVLSPHAHGSGQQGGQTMSRQQLTLLSQLRTGRQMAHAAAPALGEPHRLDLAPLFGLYKANVASHLGRPDTCFPNPASCKDSARWTYLFYPYGAHSEQVTPPGATAVQVTPVGGRAVEIKFSITGSVEQASWIRQK